MNNARPEMIVRALNGNGKPLAVLFAMLIGHQVQVSEEEIAVITGNSAKTVRTGLRVLNGLGFVTRTQYHSGWTLTAFGRQMLLDSPMLLPTGYPQYGLSSPHSSATDLPQPGEHPVKITELEEHSVKITDSPGKNYRVGLNNSTVKLSCCIDPENNLTTTTAVQENPRKIREKALRICEAVETLGWDPIWPNVADRLEQNARRGEADGLEHLVGWIAHCYVNRAAISKPASVVAADILGCRKPAKRYRERPGDYLPAAFFVAAGLEHLAPVVVDAPVEDLPLFQDIGQAEETAMDPSIDEKVGRFTPRQAWEMVLGQLKAEMPKAGFEEYVDGCQALRYANGELVVAAWDAAWMRSRLTKTAEQMLTGILNRRVKVAFVEREEG